MRLPCDVPELAPARALPGGSGSGRNASVEERELAGYRIIAGAVLRGGEIRMVRTAL